MYTNKFWGYKTEEKLYLVQCSRRNSTYRWTPVVNRKHTRIKAVRHSIPYIRTAETPVLQADYTTATIFALYPDPACCNLWAEYCRTNGKSVSCPSTSILSDVICDLIVAIAIVSKEQWRSAVKMLPCFFFPGKLESFNNGIRHLLF
jgi:hypothetical protein